MGGCAGCGNKGVQRSIQRLTNKGVAKPNASVTRVQSQPPQAVKVPDLTPGPIEPVSGYTVRKIKTGEEESNSAIDINIKGDLTFSETKE